MPDISASPVFLHYDQAELDRQYDQRAWAPNAAEIIGRYTTDSDSVRSRLGEPEVFAYGTSPAETLDLYRAGLENAPVQVFVHGGAWRSLGKRDSAFAADTFVSAGAHFVALDFALLPQVSLPEMVAQVRRAMAWLHRHARSFGGDPQRIYLSGHSSGAHLAANIAVTDWAEEFGISEPIVKGALCASGIYDLRPVRLSARARYVVINDEEEEALSPIRHLDRLQCPLIVAIGEGETDEFKRQAREFAAASASRLVELEGLNHFEVIATLADHWSLLSLAVLQQMSLTAGES